MERAGAPEVFKTFSQVKTLLLALLAATALAQSNPALDVINRNSVGLTQMATSHLMVADMLDVIASMDLNPTRRVEFQIAAAYLRGRASAFIDLEAFLEALPAESPPERATKNDL